MRNHELEFWIRQVLDRVHRREHTEDTRVELKSDWPSDHAKAARRLAGHANAAQGEPILWIIGADEKTGVVGVPTGDLDAWYRAVAACFDEIAPKMRRHGASVFPCRRDARHRKVVRSPADAQPRAFPCSPRWRSRCLRAPRRRASHAHVGSSVGRSRRGLTRTPASWT